MLKDVRVNFDFKVVGLTHSWMSFILDVTEMYDKAVSETWRQQEFLDLSLFVCFSIYYFSTIRFVR